MGVAGDEALTQAQVEDVACRPVFHATTRVQHFELRCNSGARWWELPAQGYQRRTSHTTYDGFVDQPSPPLGLINLGVSITWRTLQTGYRWLLQISRLLVFPQPGRQLARVGMGVAGGVGCIDMEDRSLEMTGWFRVSPETACVGCSGDYRVKAGRNREWVLDTEVPDCCTGCWLSVAFGP